MAARVDRGTEPGGGRSPEWMEPRCRDRAPGGWSGWLGPSPTVVKQPPEASTPQTPLGAGPSGAGWGTGSSRTPSAQGPALGRGHGYGVLGVGRAQGACGPGFGCAGLRVQLPPWPPGSAGRDHKAVPSLPRHGLAPFHFPPPLTHTHTQEDPHTPGQALSPPPASSPKASPALHCPPSLP